VVVGLSLAGWSLVIAIAGIVIAVATFANNHMAIRREQADRRKAIEDAWAFEWAAQRPVIYPVLSEISAVARLPVKNGGRGPGLNVTAELHQRLPDSGDAMQWDVSLGKVAVGDIERAGFGVPGVFPYWEHVFGVLRYRDLAGVHYSHPFQFSRNADGELTARRR
jgi:hypothetical protein